MDDRRRRLGRAGAGQLPLRRERDAAHARAPVAGCLPDEQDRRFQTGLEVASSRARRTSEPAYWLKVSPIVAEASRSTNGSQRISPMH